MSMAKRGRTCTSDGRKTTAEPLPLDLLLEILALSDVITVIRCAATSKAMRRVILGQDFRGRLAHRAEANGGFDPAVLLGVSYVRIWPRTNAAVRAKHLRFDASLLLSHELVASRDSFVILKWENPRYDALPSTSKLRFCDSLTGETYRLPPAAIRHGYPHALLTDGNGSFQLLAADRDLRTQTFSSTDGSWGPVLQTHYASQHPYSAPVKNRDYTSRPIVLGSSNIHWLRLNWRNNEYRDDPHIIALDVGSAQVTRTELPPECLSRMRCVQDARTGLQLATSPTGRLAVLVAEIVVISMWTLSETEGSTWIRHVVIKRQAIGMEPGPANYTIRFLGFGQRSGMVLLRMDAVGLVQLNLGSKDVVILSNECKKTALDRIHLCVHEINLSSLLQAMGPLRQ